MQIVYNLGARMSTKLFFFVKMVGVDEGVYFHHKICLWLMRFVKG